MMDKNQGWMMGQWWVNDGLIWFFMEFMVVQEKDQPNGKNPHTCIKAGKHSVLFLLKEGIIWENMFKQLTFFKCTCA